MAGLQLIVSGNIGAGDVKKIARHVFMSEKRKSAEHGVRAYKAAEFCVMRVIGRPGNFKNIDENEYNRRVAELARAMVMNEKLGEIGSVGQKYRKARNAISSALVLASVVAPQLVPSLKSAGDRLVMLAFGFLAAKCASSSLNDRERNSLREKGIDLREIANEWNANAWDLFRRLKGNGRAASEQGLVGR